MRALILLSFTLLAACGQSGDLYLPPEQPETPPAQPAEPLPQPAPAPPEEKKKEPPKEER